MTRSRVRDRAVSSTLQRKQAELRQPVHKNSLCNNHVCLPDPALASTPFQQAHCWLVVFCYYAHKGVVLLTSAALFFWFSWCTTAVILCDVGINHTPEVCEAGLSSIQVAILPALATVAGYGTYYTFRELWCTSNVHRPPTINHEH